MARSKRQPDQDTEAAEQEATQSTGPAPPATLLNPAWRRLISEARSGAAAAAPPGGHSAGGDPACVRTTHAARELLDELRGLGAGRLGFDILPGHPDRAGERPPVWLCLVAAPPAP